MTVEEFRLRSPVSGSIGYQLLHGEIVGAARPKLKHILIQKRLAHLLEQAAGEQALVAVEFPYRPLPEHELWIADVACVSAARITQTSPEDNLMGAPELVVEVLSPPDTAAEMYEKERICLANGGQEFWVISPERRYVRVTRADGQMRIYQAGEQIVLGLFGAAMLSVDGLFR